MRRTRTVIVALLLALVLAPASAAGPRAKRSLTILYFNDIHGRLEPWERESSGARKVGGIARMAALVKRIRRENRAAGRATILLEAGDVLQGTPMSTVFQGEPDMKAFNAMGVDAMAVGNHEFDFGQANLRRVIGLARFPVLSANVYTKEKRPLARSTTVLEPAPGLRVGVIGLTTVETPTTTFPVNVADLEFDDPVVTARHAVPLLDASCDLVVALTHIGVAEDRRLAREVPDIDVVIGGHNHIPLPEPERVGNAVICQAEEYGLYLGRLDLTIERGRVTVTRGELIPIDDRLPEDRPVAALVASYANLLKERMNVVVGRSKVRLDGDRADVRTRETNLGNLAADIMREAASADVALINSGSIRGSIESGPVTFGGVLTAFPFPNKIVAVKVPGRTLREAFDFAASLNPSDLPGGFLQVSGVKYAIENGRATAIEVGGKPLDEARLYTVAMSDFTLAGGDGYAIFARDKQGVVDTGLVLNALFVDYLRKAGEIAPAAEGRIVRRAARGAGGGGR